MFEKKVRYLIVMDDYFDFLKSFMKGYQPNP
jgi:hypothetical protein